MKLLESFVGRKFDCLEDCVVAAFVVLTPSKLGLLVVNTAPLPCTPSHMRAVRQCKVKTSWKRRHVCRVIFISWTQALPNPPLKSETLHLLWPLDLRAWSERPRNQKCTTFVSWKTWLFRLIVLRFRPMRQNLLLTWLMPLIIIGWMIKVRVTLSWRQLRTATEEYKQR